MAEKSFLDNLFDFINNLPEPSPQPSISSFTEAVKQGYSEYQRGNVQYVSDNPMLDAVKKFLGDMPADAPSDIRRIVEKLVFDLNSLGSSEAVAHFLQEQGIKGVVGDQTDCPLVRYISKHIPSDYTVEVDGDSVTVHNGDDFEIEQPEVLESFVSDFDSGEFPNLVEDEFEDDLDEDDDEEDEEDFDDFDDENDDFDDFDDDEDEED